MRPVLIALSVLAFTGAVALVALSASGWTHPAAPASAVALVWAGALSVYLTPRRSHR